MHASDDWLAQPWPRPLASKAELSLSLRQSQRETWAHQAGHPKLVEGGWQKVQRSIIGSLGLRWQATPSGSLVLGVPGVFNEMAVWNGVEGWPRVNDPGVQRSQGLGDLSLEWRQDRALDQGHAWGWSFGVVAPTGLGPWEAPHPMAGTGEGRWQALLRLTAGSDGPGWSFLSSAKAVYHAGKEAELSAAAPVSYDAAGARYLPAASTGAAYLDPRWGAEGAVGVGWHWYRSEDALHSLNLSLCASHLGPLSVGGRAVDETASLLVWVQPELQARFGELNALAGWQCPALLDDNLAVPFWGELILRVEHAF